MPRKAKAADAPPTMTAIKGFDVNLQCRGFQFEVGKTYSHEGAVVRCESGFHAVTDHPLSVFDFYPPARSRFCRVALSGKLDADNQKTAAEIIEIGEELSITGLVQEAVAWVQARAKPEGKAATGYRGAASATGNQGAASATGNRGAASATGNQGAASATGYQGAASATGDQGAASATGYQGAASATGDQGAAMASGFDGRVMGSISNALFAVERISWDGPILSVASGIVGQNGIEPGVWYVALAGKLEQA